MRRPRPPYPTIETAQTFAGGTFFRLRQPQLPPNDDPTAYDRSVGDAQRALAEAPMGEPFEPADVRSVYDVRPLNAYDFNVTLLSDATVVGGEGNAPIVMTPFAVPVGYVAVVRKYHHSIDPQPAVDARADVLLTIQANGSDLPFNVEIPVGLESDFVECFFIVDEGGSFGARYNVIVPGSVQIVIYTHVYGNFLRKTGRSANLEIANPVAGRR
jgi:hypothetical protein